MKRETFTVAVSEIRFAADDASTFTGYAALWNETTTFGEIVRRGAFVKTIAEHRDAGTPPAMFFNHNPDQPIGVWTDISEDARGLKVAGKLVTETARGAEARALLKAGAMTGLSIGFRARGEDRGPKGQRILTDIDLVEISLTSLPSARNARVTHVRTEADMAGLAAFSAAVRRAAQSMTR